MSVIETSYVFNHVSHQGELKINSKLVRLARWGDATAVLMLHGGSPNVTGKANGGAIFESVQRDLVDSGIASLAVDFPGVGNSEGRFEESTLNERVGVATNALYRFRNMPGINPNRVIVWGTSMGGDVELRMSLERVKALILQGSMAYPDRAADSKFNGVDFTRDRRIYDWRESVVFKNLDRFSGPVCLVTAELDKVIPVDVALAYRAAVLNHGGQSHVIPGAPHAYLSQGDHPAIGQLTSIVRDFILHSV